MSCATLTFPAKRRRCCVDGDEIKLNTVLQQHSSTRVSRITFVAAAGPLHPKWPDAEDSRVAPAAVHRQGCWRSRDGAETSPAVQVEMRRSSRYVSDSVQRQSGGFQLCNREQMPPVQFQSVTQRQIPVQRVQKKIEIPQVQFLTRWSMLLLCRFTGLRHGKDGRDPTVAACTAKR